MMELQFSTKENITIFVDVSLTSLSQKATWIIWTSTGQYATKLYWVDEVIYRTYNHRHMIFHGFCFEISEPGIGYE